MIGAPAAIDKRPIAGFEALYDITSDGRVWSVEREVTRILSGREKKYRYGGHFLAGQTDKDGYQYVRLCDGTKRRKGLIHRLVLEAFVGPCPPGMEAAHKNGDPADNRLENLLWKTHRSNCADKAAHGTVLVGSEHPRAKLDEEKVRLIRSSPMSAEQLAVLLSVHPGTVYHIRSRRSWRHVTE